MPTAEARPRQISTCSVSIIAKSPVSAIVDDQRTSWQQQRAKKNRIIWGLSVKNEKQKGEGHAWPTNGD